MIGEGGFARVYKALEVGLDRVVALKVLKPKGDGYPPGTRARFDREVRVIANLSDTHTVTVYDWGRSAEGLLYLAFEFVDGRDLGEVLEERGPLDDAGTVRVLTQMLYSLREAHHNNLLHRDIKPQNIMIYEYSGDPLCAKLLDFGIAKPLTGDATILTQAGVLVGSPRYMSPDQLMDIQLTPASDIFSLGLVAWEMMTGQPMRTGSNLRDMLKNLGKEHQHKLDPSLNVGPHLEGVVRKMLGYDLTDRFRNAQQVLKALEDLPLDLRPTEEHPRQARPTQPPGALSPYVPSDETATDQWQATPAAPTQRADVAVGDEARQQPNMLAIILGGGAIAAVLGLAVILALRAPPPAAADVDVAATQPGVPTQALAKVPEPDPEPAPELTAEGEDDAGPPADESPGCGKEPQFVGTGKLVHRDGLQTRDWTVHVPKSYDKHLKHPVLFFFHEEGEGPTTALERTEFTRYADERGFVIIAPKDRGSVRVWRKLVNVKRAGALLWSTAEHLCLDTRSVFAFGHGTGGRAVDRLHCVVPVRAAASSAHRPEESERFCKPTPAQPYLHIAPLEDLYDPVDGKGKCWDVDKWSLPFLEEQWATRNGCGEREARKIFGATCYKYDCSKAPFISCHAAGGHRWPGQKPRGTTGDFLNCDNGEMSVPIADVVWEFFDRNIAFEAVTP